MDEELEVLKQFIQILKLDQKERITERDVQELANLLDSADEKALSYYVKNLYSPQELEDLITSTMYG
jgi:hypothetical protein